MAEVKSVEQAVKATGDRELNWKEFLETVPPESVVTVVGKCTAYSNGTFSPEIIPPLQLQCGEPECQSVMWFDHVSGRLNNEAGELGMTTYRYKCRHCQKGEKFFSIVWVPENRERCRTFKSGEVPPFGSHTPARVISLIGPDKELFLKGRKAENRGLGIGAFAYYRRVVENQKNRVLQEVLKVAKKVNAKAETILALEQAIKENQFSKAVDSVKDAIPESLLMDGYNPLKLLHSALSKGMHEQDDAKCLELAQSIRVVLTELAERISTVLKEQAELKSAVSKILQSNSVQKSEGK